MKMELLSTEYRVKRIEESGISFVRLGYLKDNPQSEAFWMKNNFEKTGVELQVRGCRIVVMQKYL